MPLPGSEMSHCDVLSMLEKIKYCAVSVDTDNSKKFHDIFL